MFTVLAEVREDVHAVTCDDLTDALCVPVRVTGQLPVVDAGAVAGDMVLDLAANIVTPPVQAPPPLQTTRHWDAQAPVHSSVSATVVADCHNSGSVPVATVSDCHNTCSVPDVSVGDCHSIGSVPVATVADCHSLGSVPVVTVPACHVAGSTLDIGDCH